jgi:MFS family permease
MSTTSILRSRPPAASRSQQGGPGTLRGRLNRPSVFLFVILTSQLMVVLDTTIVNVALPHIEGGLHFSGSGLSWVLNAYLLTFGGLLLLGARCGDLLGRRRTFLTGIAIFSLSSLLGGFAVTGWMLLSARALQGVGAALAAPSSLALLTTVFAEGSQRVRAIGLFTTVSAAGGAIGLVAGGILTELVSWRWVMFVNVPIGLVVWLVGRVVLVETERRHGHFDVAGALTSTLGMGSLVLGLVEARPRGGPA